MNAPTKHQDIFRSLHILGVLYGLAAGAWLGTAEAPAKLVTQGFSPFIISTLMVLGVFTAQWIIPASLKGITYVFIDVKTKAHLIIWAIIAGALWAIANTLTIFAIRDIGLAIAFPIWNSNCLVGLFWGWLFFRELRGAGKKQLSKILGGVIAIVIATTILALTSTQQVGISGNSSKIYGVIAALTAGLMWGTMYIPYRKAYISGMNPLSFVTVFTIGEVLTMVILSIAISIFITLAFFSTHVSLYLNLYWLIIIIIAMLGMAGLILYKRIHFSAENRTENL